LKGNFDQNQKHDCGEHDSLLRVPIDSIQDCRNAFGIHFSPRRCMTTEAKMNARRLAAMFTFKPIGFVQSPFKETSQIPRGLGAKHETEGVLEILREYEPGLMDIEGFSHLYVLWAFDRSQDFDLISCPPTDEKQPHGVFATRSPRRPNPIALTVVELLGRNGASLRVRGVDMLDGTPILDIKPYLSSVPAEKLKRGWLAEAEARKKAGA
jgi:tRNA-Thr(GGU) m(6)t(6)A37 methyltransferase TsaA